MKPIQDIIDIAKVSEYLCNVDIRRKGLYGGGRDLLLPYKINNIRKSVEFLKEYETVANANATSIVYFSDPGYPGDTISISVDDPIYGMINLMTYVIQPSDTTRLLLINSIVSVFGTPYGYHINGSYPPYSISIMAPNDRGATMNGIELICTYTSIDAFSTEDNNRIVTENNNYLIIE